MRRLGVLVVCLSACAHAPAPGLGRPDPVRLVARLKLAATGGLQVHLTVPQAALPSSAEQVAFTFPRMPRGYRERLTGLPVAALVSSARDLTLDYEVPLLTLGASAPWPALHGCFRSPAGAQLNLWAVLPRFTSARGDWDLSPAELEVAAALPVTSSLPGEGGSYLAASADELYTGLVLVGRAREVVSPDGLRLVTLDLDARTLERAAELEARATAALARRFGPRRPLGLLALHAHPSGGLGPGIVGLNGGQTATVLVGTPLDGRATSRDGNTLLHELVHASLPPEDDLPPWMREGITEYVTRRLGLELDRLPEVALRESLAATWQAFVESTPSRRAGDTAIGTYYGGAVLAHCVDVRLRRDGSSLDEVLRRARTRAGGALGNRLWEEEIAVASAPAGALVLGARANPLDPIERCFREEGYRPGTPIRGVRQGYLRQALGLRAVDAQPGHLDVLVVEAAPGLLEPGDALLALDGERVLSLDHLRELLGRPRAGAGRLEVSRLGERLHLAITAAPPRAEDLVRVERPVWVPPR
jgi:hypothetical protein